ncbi:PREDICTED: E3 ubiquitin-protein ligase TRAIP [Dufourea novaeangliae]|uniref:TRAF-interacting protein n=1 Tax=Dufourea novaeangliae TaxID=178035 RepID=A0A154P9P1_DUFNO|nr:PREDICTED: E3 ubiquitin-protein ligase TRAIP [Dufourea novaeangliae]KZC08551.1 TRAF-interacting protein [Dufourea novaeangliae]
MNIVCIICSDLLTPSDDVFYTPCGHIFHFVCLTRWLDRSKSCPQCREKTTAIKIHRIYFNFSNNEAITEDTCSLQEKVDKLSLQLACKEKSAKDFSEKCQALEKEAMCLRKDLMIIETEKNTAIRALKQQLQYFKEQASETSSMKQENEQLKKRIEDCKNIETLLHATSEDVDEMLSRSCDLNTLVTYISVMKREMTVSMNKRRELRSKVKSLQQELIKVSTERNFLSQEHTKRKKLEEDLMVCESENMFLQTKLSELKNNTLLAQQSSTLNSQLDNLNCNPRNICKPRKTAETVNNENIEKENTDEDEKNPPVVKKNNQNKNNSPYLPVKSGGVFVLKQLPSNKRSNMDSTSSILVKKPRIGQPRVKMEHSVTYDGFGGHSKYEHFPSSSGSKMKKLSRQLKLE